MELQSAMPISKACKDTICAKSYGQLSQMALSKNMKCFNHFRSSGQLSTNLWQFCHLTETLTHQCKKGVFETVSISHAVEHCTAPKYTPGGILRGGVLEAGFEGAQPLATFLNLCGFRVPGNDILALDEVQTVLYTHMVKTRFLYRSAGLHFFKVCPKKPRSQI